MSRLLNLPIPEVQRLLKKYRGIPLRPAAEEPRVVFHPFRFPRPNGPLTRRGKDYLSRRGFDPEHLEHEWGLLETGPVSFLDHIPYEHRVIIPIKWDGEVVSFQARDITERSERKYLACPKRREKIHHKDILYGRQEVWQNSEVAIIVEGPTDVWRLGPLSVATLGIEFKMEQVMRLIHSHARRFIVVFDDEPQAQAQANQLVVKLRAMGKVAWLEMVEGDPGGMKPEDADHFVKWLVAK